MNLGAKSVHSLPLYFPNNSSLSNILETANHATETYRTELENSFAQVNGYLEQERSNDPNGDIRNSENYKTRKGNLTNILTFSSILCAMASLGIREHALNKHERQLREDIGKAFEERTVKLNALETPAIGRGIW
jgi:hypothetical protein